jgi:aminobenzoyl-glutamate utilization protein B
MDALKRKVLDAIDASLDETLQVSRTLFEFAEVALEETRSAALLADRLRSAGFEVEHGTGGMPTAFIARCGTGRPAVGFLAEYDALPNCGATHDRTGHGCGHNLIGSGTVFAAIAAARVMKDAGLPGQIVCYGCPAEETLEGKAYMARDGAFAGLDAALSWHPLDGSYARGDSTNAMDSIVFEFHGKTAHAAFDPWNGRSALDGVEIMNYGVNMMREHMPEEARIHYVITNGGDAPNVVPAYARVWYFIRAPKRAMVNALRARVEKCARAGALASETEVKMTLLTAVYDMLPNEALAQCLQRNLEIAGAPRFSDEDRALARELGFTAPLDEGIRAIGGGITRSSNERGNVSWLAPLGAVWAACHAPGTPIHSWAAARQYGSPLGEKGMLTATKTLALAAVELLTSPDLVREARAEFDRKTAGFVFDPVIPPGQKPNPLGSR